jgi:hypothetical protein
MKRFPWRGAIGLALTVLLLWLAFRNTQWAEMWRVLREADYRLAALSVFVVTLVFPLRALRWRPILHTVAPNLPFGAVWRPTAIGMMANNVLPARIGELVRAYMLSRETSVPFSAGFASLVVDRVFDGTVIVILMLVAMLDPAFPAGESAANYIGSGVAMLVLVLLALYAVVFFPDRLIGLFELVVRRVAPSLEEKGRVMLHSFAEGLSVLRHPGRFIAVFLWTLAHWLVNALAFWIMFQAVGVEAPLSAALFVQGLIVVGVALPAAPGFFGVWEFTAILGLKMYGVDENLAGAWAIGFHVLSLIPITLIGIYYVLRSGTKFGELKSIER